jgi:hypothetical protein
LWSQQCPRPSSTSEGACVWACCPGWPIDGSQVQEINCTFQ